MPEKITLFTDAVEIDRSSTRQWYAQAEEWGCECAGCRNFLALAKARQLPGTVMDMLRMLELPPEKATYVCRIVEREGMHLYQFSYRIAGNMLQEEKRVMEAEGRCCHETYPYGAPDFPEPHFDLEFYVELPWILEDESATD